MTEQIGVTYYEMQLPLANRWQLALYYENSNGTLTRPPKSVYSVN
jgi:hypothetical protein